MSNLVIALIVVGAIIACVLLFLWVFTANREPAATSMGFRVTSTSSPKKDEEPIPEVADATPKKKRILFIKESEALARMVAWSLREKGGYEVIIPETLQDLDRELANKAFDLILTGTRFRGITDEERLAERYQQVEVPIIVSTGGPEVAPWFQRNAAAIIYETEGVNRDIETILLNAIKGALEEQT